MLLPAMDAAAGDSQWVPTGAALSFSLYLFFSNCIDRHLQGGPVSTNAVRGVIPAPPVS